VWISLRYVCGYEKSVDRLLRFDCRFRVSADSGIFTLLAQEVYAVSHLIKQLTGCIGAATACKLYRRFFFRINGVKSVSKFIMLVATLMNTVYSVKTLSQLRPLLLGFRKTKGLTQKDVAERLGVTQQTYARLEVNPASASIERLFRVFAVLGVELTLSSAGSSAVTGTAELADKYANSPARREKW